MSKSPTQKIVPHLWPARQRVQWERRLDQLDDHLQTMKEQQS